MRPVNPNPPESADGMPNCVIAVNECSMIEINESHYEALSHVLADAIAGKSFFNGSVNYDCDEFSARLTATLIIYRDSDNRERINNIVPVWWEFSTADPNSRQMLNDFCFSELKQLTINN